MAVLQHQLQELRSNYQALAEVAIELVEALEATTNGKAVVMTINYDYNSCFNHSHYYVFRSIMNTFIKC